MNIIDFLSISQLKRTASLIFATAIVLSSAAGATAQVVYDDSVDGTASSDGATPTLIDFNVGSNFVNGIVATGGELDNTRNFYTFVIDANQELDAIVLDSLTVTTATGTPSNDPGFFALVAGTTSVNPGGGFPNLGGDLFAPVDVGDDLLALVSGGGISSGTGFTTIGPGDYTFVIQQTGSEVSSYSLDFQVSSTAVPEPTSAIVLVGLGFAGLARRRR